MYRITMHDKIAVIMGVANKRSLAWGIADGLHEAGARIAFTYIGHKFGSNVRQLGSSFRGARFYECNVMNDDQISDTFEKIGHELGQIDILVHSIAFSPREELGGRFINTTRDGYRMAMEISAFSLIRVAHAAYPLMRDEGGSIVAMTYGASQRGVPAYNVMGGAKASLEHHVRQLAAELGPHHIRVNAISAGPVSTLSARGVKGFPDMLKHHRAKAPLRRNITQTDIGKAGVFLCSDLSSGVTGEVLHVDGGYNIMGM